MARFFRGRGVPVTVLLLGAVLLPSPLLADSDPGELRFDDPTLEVSEAGSAVILTVRRKSGEQGEVSVQVRTEDGSAKEGEDYEGLTETLTWPPGDDEDRILVVTILDDLEEEGTETFAAVLSNPTGGATLDADKSIALVEILDDDGEDEDEDPEEENRSGVLKFDERSFEVIESAGTAIVTVERSQGEDGAVTVDFTTRDGTALDGEDYTQVSGTLEWSDGDGSDRTFAIPILDDELDEPEETIQLALSNVTGGASISVERGESIVRILDDDQGPGNDDPGDDPGVLEFDQATFVSSEGNAVAVITVERSMGEAGEVSVEFSTRAGSATAGEDYQETVEILSWPSGDGGLRSVTIPLLDDELEEGSETVDLLLAGPTGGATLDPERGTAVLTILDDDGGIAPPGEDPGIFKFDVRGFQVVEGQSEAIIGVERSMGEDGAVSVDFSTSDGSAVAGEDYQAVAGTLSWAAEDGRTQTFSVPILDDALEEGNETVNLALRNPTGGASLDPERRDAILEILDDDATTRSCVADSSTLCLAGGRFEVEVVWRLGNGKSGRGRMIPVSESAGLVWFFSEDNAEMLIKTLDACQVSGLEAYWVFYAATTNVDFTVTVTDTFTGLTKQYSNVLGHRAEPVQDTLTFRTCP